MGTITKEKQLADLLLNLNKYKAPTKLERYGKHCEFVISIGTNETATITMSEKAYEELIKENK